MIKLVDIGIIVLSSGIFLLCYMLFLRKEKYHQLNRAYLLFSLMFSSLLPFIRFSIPKQPLLSNTQIFLTTVTKTSTIPFGTILYVTVAVLFFILFLLKLFKVLRQIIRKHYVEMNGLKVIDNPEHKVPFSFFHYIVVDFTTFEPYELDLVLRHEAAHARQRHTLDLLFVEVVGIVCWFNPFVWAYKSALKSLHEYAADAAVLQSEVSESDYLDLILKQIRKQNRMVPVHSFSAWAIKSRLRMMVEIRSGQCRWLRYFSVVPIVVFLVVGSSLLASAKNVPLFMENVIVPAVDSQPLSEYSDKADTIPTKRFETKRVVCQTKVSAKPTEENVSSPNVLESQSWLSTQYGDPVEIYEEKPVSKPEEIYFVRTTGDAPVIYRVNTCKIPPISH